MFDLSTVVLLGRHRLSNMNRRCANSPGRRNNIDRLIRRARNNIFYTVCDLFSPGRLRTPWRDLMDESISLIIWRLFPNWRSPKTPDIDEIRYRIANPARAKCDGGGSHRLIITYFRRPESRYITGDPTTPRDFRGDKWGLVNRFHLFRKRGVR